MRQAQTGASALAMVLVLLITGSLLLKGLSQQLTSDIPGITSETRAIRQFSQALSAQQWGMRQHWHPTSDWQCQQYPAQHWRACLIQEKKQLILAAHTTDALENPIVLWRLGQWSASGIQFSTHGWSDFCPLTDTILCALP